MASRVRLFVVSAIGVRADGRSGRLSNELRDFGSGVRVLMSDHDISQAEADHLFGLAKRRKDDTTWVFPGVSESIMVPLTSEDGREEFILDVSRGRIDLLKATYQNRARQMVILARIDLGGPPHRNPDGVEIPCPHIHKYTEGYGTKWAKAVPSSQFTHLGDLFGTLQDFMTFCNVVEPPVLDAGLF